MNVRRDRLQIINDILLSVREKNGKIRPTHLLYKSNLAHNKMKLYVNGQLLPSTVYANTAPVSSGLFGG